MEAMTLDDVMRAAIRAGAVADQHDGPNGSVKFDAKTFQAFVRHLNAHLAQPAQAVDVGAIREVIAELESVVQTAKMPSFYRDNVASQIGKLTRALSGEKAGPVGDGWVSAMVDRFLGWRLPDDFSPDDGISFVPPKHPNSWPVGTNLFSVKQAEAMFRHALGALDGYVIVPAHRSEAEIRSFYGRMEGRTHD
jgi:hypothetical protein